MSKKKDIVYQNTDRELYREESEGLGMGYYANSVHVTKDGRIGMNVGGYVIVMPIAEWHALAKKDNPVEFGTL